jgi:flagellar biosynthesis protein
MMYKHFHRPSRKKDDSTRAAVIRYDKENNKAPTIVAQGRGEVAEKIIAKAKEYDIPLQEDALLLENLLELDLGSNVPPQLYQVVAEVLLFVRRANQGDSIPSISSPSSVRHTPYWEEEDDDVSLDDLLSAIKKI